MNSTALLQSAVKRRPLDGERTLADLLEQLGGVSSDRIRLCPPVGTAVDVDATVAQNCELLEGTLVEVAMGMEESVWGAYLIHLIARYLANNPIGFVAGADALTRVRPGRLRIPDVAVYLARDFPGGKVRLGAVSDIAPVWAVEILSPSNTIGEMAVKRADFFAAGTQLFWQVDPRQRVIEAYDSPDSMIQLTVNDSVNLDAILPGFILRIAEWFEMLDAVTGD